MGKSPVLILNKNSNLNINIKKIQLVYLFFPRSMFAQNIAILLNPICKICLAEWIQ